MKYINYIKRLSNPCVYNIFLSLENDVAKSQLFSQVYHYNQWNGTLELSDRDAFVSTPHYCYCAARCGGLTHLEAPSPLDEDSSNPLKKKMKKTNESNPRLWKKDRGISIRIRHVACLASVVQRNGNGNKVQSNLINAGIT